MELHNLYNDFKSTLQRSIWFPSYDWHNWNTKKMTKSTSYFCNIENFDKIRGELCANEFGNGEPVEKKKV